MASNTPIANAIIAVVTADYAAMGVDPLVVAAAVAEQLTFAQREAFEVLDFAPGSETPVTQSGLELGVELHLQYGSPSSWPFVWPSPSESFSQNAVVHLRPAPSKPLPNWLFGLSPSGFTWPSASTPGTFLPFGTPFPNEFHRLDVPPPA